MNDATAPPASSTRPSSSAWSPLRQKIFAVLWLATVVSNVGTWMQNAATGWLMTSLSASPFDVAMVQAVGTLPMFLLSLPAGALADTLDRRRLLIWMQTAAVANSAVFAVLVALGWVTPNGLLVFIAFTGVTAILSTPAWQAIVPQLVPHSQLSAAVALNGVGFNISRAIGPALAGLAIAAFGIAMPFWLNAAATLAAIGALVWWRSEPIAHPLPVEHFVSAMRVGLRYARHDRDLRATCIRSAGFFPLAGIYWALLPLVARYQIAGGPELYGTLLGAIGLGAVGGAFFLPAAKARLGADGLAAAATGVTAVALMLFAVARDPSVALVACALAGVAWIAMIATLTVSAQLSLPAWVRGRGLAVFATVQFAGLALGSALWGKVAEWTGLPAAHLAAAAALVVLMPVMRRWKLPEGEGADLSPSLHWPAPILTQEPEPDRGPVLVTVEYRVSADHRAAFLKAIALVAEERLRDGAYDWGIYQDVASDEVFIETFHVESWLEHMRQHQRVTNADRIVEDAADRFQIAGRLPQTRHLIAAHRGHHR